jgi:hypothetical protein
MAGDWHGFPLRVFAPHRGLSSGVDANVIAQDRDNPLTNCTVDQEAANSNQAFLDFGRRKM